MGKYYRNITEVKKACREVSSTAAGSDAFMYRCFSLLLQQLLDLNKNVKELLRKLSPATEKSQRLRINATVAKYWKGGDMFDKDGIIRRIEELSHGSGGVVVMTGNDWEVLNTAYGGNPLIQKIGESALIIHPVRSVPGGELSFAEEKFQQ